MARLTGVGDVSVEAVGVAARAVPAPVVGKTPVVGDAVVVPLEFPETVAGKVVLNVVTLGVELVAELAVFAEVVASLVKVVVAFTVFERVVSEFSVFARFGVALA